MPKISPLSPLSSSYSSKSFSKSSSVASKSKSKAKSIDKFAKESSTAPKDDDAFPGTEDLDAGDADLEDLSNVADPPPPIDKTLDVGPKGLPLFAKTRSVAELDLKDACTYMDFGLADLIVVLAEGLPSGMKREFKETRRSAFLCGITSWIFVTTSGALLIHHCTIKEYNVWVNSTSDKSHYIGRFPSGLLKFSKNKNMENKWSLHKEGLQGLQMTDSLRVFSVLLYLVEL